MNDYFPDIIFLRGAPGIGKSTFSRNLKPYIPNGITIEVGPILKMINAFEDSNSTQYTDTLDLIYQMIRQYIGKGYKPIVVVGPMKALRMSNYFLNRLEDIKILIITFYATQKELFARIDGRKKGFRDKKVAKIVNQDMQTFRLPNEWLINTSGKIAEEVFEIAYSQLVKMFNQ